MTKKPGRVCPVEQAGSLDHRFRRWVQDPRKLLRPYIDRGMTTLDLGCGPGFFTVEMARLVGTGGQVIAADLQEGMLQKLKAKVSGTGLEDRIVLHRCENDCIGVSAAVDFVLAFYVVHEVPDHSRMFREIMSILNPGGRVFIAEPPLHVSRRAFEATVEMAARAGLKVVDRPKVFLSKAAVLRQK